MPKSIRTVILACREHAVEHFGRAQYDSRFPIDSRQQIKIIGSSKKNLLSIVVPLHIKFNQLTLKSLMASF
jgi:hypothetical protein